MSSSHVGASHPRSWSSRSTLVLTRWKMSLRRGSLGTIEVVVQAMASAAAKETFAGLGVPPK